MHDDQVGRVPSARQSAPAQRSQQTPVQSHAAWLPARANEAPAQAPEPPGVNSGNGSGVSRMTFAEVAAMMRQPSFGRPLPVPPALHQMTRRRIIAAANDSPADDNSNPKEITE